MNIYSIMKQENQLLLSSQ